ncbi:hypothetical protein KSK37_04345 [Kaistella sp. DKR-2]|uniref:DUF6904 family protein n=1 Tax=Kaistella soli TaxID=2849654 RepID=UPI001C27F5B8|nr:hypothetical protein [Kaistella soli]MBU8882310.1 hypothetical protein [Kaistella soli]
MIYIIPTKGGLGVEVWGTYDDLSNFYNVIGKFWNNKDKLTKKGFDNRDNLISGFSYEIRKSKDGNRLKRNSSHFSFEEQKHYGVQISWVHFLFSLTALKFNMRYCETNKFDISQILLIEFWLEKAMISYDEIGAKNLIGFIEDGLYGGNNHIYQCMRSVNLDFFILGGGKRAFRKLPDLLKRGVYYTDEYKDYLKFLEEEAKKLNCEISELELSDDDFDYENLKW